MKRKEWVRGITKVEPSLYVVWTNMKLRCYNTKHHNYKWYGGKGITICDEWLNNYYIFYKWAKANGYKKGLTIDRGFTDNNYSPENCKWVTMLEQAKTKKNVHLIPYNGELKLVSELMKELNLSEQQVKYKFGIIQQYPSFKKRMKQYNSKYNT